MKLKSGYRIEYNEEKNLLLKETRGIGFEEIIWAIEKGKVLRDTRHPNLKRYPNQRVIVVSIRNYAYAVPYVTDKRRKVIFLKTAYPSRTLTKQRLKTI